MSGPTAIDALVFDVIGTVVDVSGTLTRTMSAVLSGGDSEAADAVRRWEGRIGENMQGIVAGAAPWRPHETLRREALEGMRRDGELPSLSDAEIETLATAVCRLDPWPDSAAALAALRDRFTIIALSNADPAELARLSRHGGLAWHAALSASYAKSYKPNPAVYRMVLEQLQLESARSLFVAAHPWDLRAAAEHGFATAYIARPDAEVPSPTDAFDIHVGDLGELAVRLGARPA